MVNKLKKKLIVNKSKYTEDWILFLHNETKHGDGWKQLFRGTRSKCLNIKRCMENEKVF